MTETTSTVKKVTRRKTVTPTVDTITPASTPSAHSPAYLKAITDIFTDLTNAISSAKAEFEALQKEVAQMKEAWAKEQKDHELEVKERNQQEELERSRERETYEYETKLIRRQAQDEFEQKKMQWERELSARKEEIDTSMRELAELKKLSAGFEAEKVKAVKEATFTLQKELSTQFETARKLREQEVKAEKDLLSLRITNLTSDHTRQSQEIEALKKGLDDATRQLKDVAVKVIESSSAATKPAPAQEA